MKLQFSNLLSLLKLNIKIIENYFMMTILQALNSFFYLLVLPFLFRKVGAESYGLFVYISSIASFLSFLLNLGLDIPATKRVAENFSNNLVLSKIYSQVTLAKICLSILIISVIVFLSDFLPFIQQHEALFYYCFLSTVGLNLFPIWLFQGLQKMKIVTLIQFLCRLISLPFIFLLINTSNDINLYSFILAITNFGSLIIIFLILNKFYGIRYVGVKYNDLRMLLKEGQPILLAQMIGGVREYSIPILLAHFFSYKEVAVYDLANKLILVPKSLFLSINAAIFPKLIIKKSSNITKKVIKYEYILSIFTIVLLAFSLKFIVILIGGIQMIQSYYLAILLSVSILPWLVVGAFVNFIFIPTGNRKYIMMNQIFTTLVFFISCLCLLYTQKKSIYFFGLSIAIAAVVEVLYCEYIIRAKKLL